MKLTAIILLSACLTVSAKGVSQITLSETNVPLQKVFKEIKKQTGYGFLFQSELLEEAGNVTVKLRNVSLQNALEEVLKGKKLSYEIMDKTVIIKKEPEKKIEEQITLALPSVEIKGVVTSEDGLVAGATVVIKRTGTGTSANNRGEFSIKDVEDNDMLIVSAIGYQTQEVSVKGKTFIYIQLKLSENKLDEIVIRPYGQNTTRRLNTGSISKITGEEIAKQPINNLLQALAGRFTGLSISQASGLPGSDVSFQIRGQNSINTAEFESVPLVVIDGVPYPNVPINKASQYGSNTYNFFTGAGGYGSPLYNINSNDIESVEILKDADATAIYGSRAGNGVMLITTKKGRQGKTSFTANVNTGVGLNLSRVDLLSPVEYRALRREAFANSNLTPNAANAPDLLVWDSTLNTDWQKDLLGHTARLTDASLSMSGGAGGTSFLISGNYHKENSVYPDRRGSESGGAHYSINHVSATGKFSAGLSGMLNSNKIELPQGPYGSYAYLIPPNFSVYDSSGNLKWDWNGNNPYGNMKTTFRSKTFSLTSNLQLRYTILPGLDAKASIGITKVETDQQQISPKAAANPANTFFQSQNYQTINRSQTLNVEPQLNYVRSIAKGKLDALVGATIMKTINEMPASINATNFSSDAYINDISLAGSITVQKGYSAYQYASVFSRVNYNWQNKYILNGSFRRDGSSRFGPNNRFGNFGAIGAAWLFNKETFAQNWGFLSYGKLRGSIGWVGSDNTHNYGYLSTYTSVPFYSYAGNPGLIPARLYNPDYSWESTRKLEGAVELGFLKDRILLTTAWFQNRTGNQLVNYPISSQAGFENYTANLNAALVENKGWEVELNTTNIANKNFRWITSFNITIPQNKLLRFDGIERTGYTSSLVVGKPLTSIYSVHFQGTDSTGKLLYDDVNKNGSPDFFGGLAVYNKGDKQYVGKSYADFYGGLTNSFSYKGFQLDFTFQFTKGLKKPGYLAAISQPGQMANIPRKAVSDFRAMGVDKAFIRSGTSFDYIYYSRFSDALYVDASFARLTNAAVSYTFPEKMVKRLKLGSLKVYVNAQNLFVISNYDGFDPESGAVSMPPLFRLVGGIQCSF